MADNKTQITAAQRKAVWDTFKSLGYSPSTEAEVDYWAAKPAGQLFAELKKRQDAQPKGQLTNGQLFALYDEAGLAGRLKSQADYDWAKKNLPNDTEAVRKVLKVEQGKVATAQKAAAKPNATITPQPTANNQKQDPGVNPAMMDSASSTPAPKLASGAFTSENGYLVKFTGDPNGAGEGDASTLWFADTATNTMRPIMSMQAFNDLYGNDQAKIAAAKKSINTLDIKQIQSGGAYSDFFLLGADYGIKAGGVKKDLDFSPKEVGSRYGKPVSQSQVKAAALLDNTLNLWKGTDSGIPKELISKIQKDPAYVAGLIGAIAYGDYSVNDIWQELKRKQAADAGDTTAQSTRVIDKNMPKAEYAKTEASQLVSKTYPLPAMISGMDTSLLNSPANAMPDSLYDTIFKGDKLNTKSPEFQAAASKIKSDIHDHLLNMMNAETEGAKMIAEQDFLSWKTAAEKKLGISLEDDAYGAWNQVTDMINKSQEAGLAGSGIAEEAQDKMLSRSRLIDDRNREATKLLISEGQRKDDMSNASPEEIKKMNEEDAAAGLPREQWRSVLMNLAPKEEMNLAKFIAKYRSDYPTNQMTDAQIKTQFYDSQYDDNGNYRSTLYANAQDKRDQVMAGGTLEQRGSTESYPEAQTRLESARRTEEYNNLHKQLNPEIPENIADAKLLDEVSKDVINSATSPETSSEIAKTLTNRYKIKNTNEMGLYDPSQYSRESDKSVYLNQGLTPETAKKVATAAKTTSTYTPPKGYEAIKNPTQISNYQPNNTITKNNTLYGVPKVAPTVVNKPATSAFTPKPGTSQISNEAAMKNYTNIYKDTTPGSKKLYGTLRK